MILIRSFYFIFQNLPLLIITALDLSVEISGIQLVIMGNNAGRMPVRTRNIDSWIKRALHLDKEITNEEKDEAGTEKKA